MGDGEGRGRREHQPIAIDLVEHILHIDGSAVRTLIGMHGGKG